MAITVTDTTSTAAEPTVKAKRTRVNKRKRVSRACNYCRIRKHRCDGTHPTCSRCSAIHQPCSYGSDNKKRGLPTGYVHALKLLWSLVFTVVPNSTNIVKGLISDIQFSLDSRSRLVMENPYIKDSETLKQAWDESGVQKQLDQLLSDIQESNTAGESLANTDKTKSEVIDTPPSLSFEAIRSVSGDISMDNSHPVHSYNADSPMISRSKMLETTPQKYPGSTIIFTQHVKRLLDGYFARTHPWLPIVQKYKMLELIYTLSRNTQAEKGNMTTLWAVLAYSSLQGSRDTSTTVDYRESLPTPEQLLDSEGGEDSHERRLLLSCFVLDTIVSCQLRKPPHLRTEDAYFSSTLAETGPDEWESQAVSFVKSRNASPTYQPSRAISIFNQYVGAIRILNDAMLDPMTSDHLCIKNLLALRHWQDHVPQHCVLSAPPGQDRLGPVSSSSPQLVNLHLAFKSTAIFLKM
ncbi:hypothetical protein FOVG_18698 [Fusarium oxysporum f. sp. pisi HDV247]|uniref:Zn(2)-C6 fungal-type domain-containing protein n=1 Tax=Fusarium oxysporum f. sp. pisi HDV247 TaxID=1080344 RepID=W9NB52_FUSOX|nr:hypothetical protein FOVG_18698 [Fusarium oxysporum f. sp. pisi HDV247]